MNEHKTIDANSDLFDNIDFGEDQPVHNDKTETVEEHFQGGTNQESKVIPPKRYTEIMQSQPSQEIKTEADLIQRTRDLKDGVEIHCWLSYYQMGTEINSFYKGKYGRNELQKIADAIEVKRPTLHKACKFAKIYSREDIQKLLMGSYSLSWRAISDNLSVQPVKLIEAYENSSDVNEFYHAMINFKNPSETRGRRRIAITRGNESQEISDLTPANEPNQEITEPASGDIIEVQPEKIIPDENSAQADIQQAILDKHVEEMLSVDISKKDSEIAKLKELISDLNSKISEKDRLIGLREKELDIYVKAFKKQKRDIEILKYKYNTIERMLDDGEECEAVANKVISFRDKNGITGEA